MLLLVDNYEELQQNMKDNERTRVMGQIEYTISKAVTESGGLLLKTCLLYTSGSQIVIAAIRRYIL